MACIRFAAVAVCLILPAMALAQRPAALDDGSRLPITLPAALQLAQARPLDIAIAAQRLQAALAQRQRARTFWLPTIIAGVDYSRHDGQLQDIVGNVFGTGRQSLMFGAGPTAVFNVSEAVHGPLAARQLVRSREADVQSAANDMMVAVAESYFNVQQARGDLASALKSLSFADTLTDRARELAEGLAPPLEASRARTERARRRQAVTAAYERWHVAAAELSRLLRLPPAVLVEPEEPANVEIPLVDLGRSTDDLLATALTNRPELASRQALVQAALQRVKQERQRPLTPNLLVRGNATNPSGSFSGGVFGGGVGGEMTNFGGRHSLDMQLTWEFRNLLLGNRAEVRERRAESEQAILELIRTQELISAEVMRELARARGAAERIPDATEALELANETVERSIEGMKQTRRVGETVVLVVRPAEVVAALQALAQAQIEYFAAIADHNRAQFRLYRALGQPAQCLALPVELAPEPIPSRPAAKTPASPFNPPTK